jgi:hypothetical protein
MHTLRRRKRRRLPRTSCPPATCGRSRLS